MAPGVPRVGQLLENLRAYGQLSEGAVELAPEPITLADAIPELLAVLGPLLGERRIDLDVGGVVVHADRVALDRILRNLLGNTVRHTPAGAAVHLRAWTDDPSTVLEVADDGPGIPTRIADRLFEGFASGERGGNGSGCPSSAATSSCTVGP